MQYRTGHLKSVCFLCVICGIRKPINFDSLITIRYGVIEQPRETEFTISVLSNDGYKINSIFSHSTCDQSNSFIGY